MSFINSNTTELLSNLVYLGPEREDIYTFNCFESSLACKMLASFDWPYAFQLLYLWIASTKIKISKVLLSYYQYAILLSSELLIWHQNPIRNFFSSQ